jgi:mRNA interferase RelE/StbE
MYEIEFHLRAAKDLERLDRAVASKILAKIRWLAANLGTIKPEALVGQFEGLSKLRVGDYRVIYQLDHEAKVLKIELVGHRRESYNQL